MTSLSKRSTPLNLIIVIYFLVSLVIGFSVILFGLQHNIDISLVKDIVIIALLIIFLILVILWKKIGIYGVVATHFTFIISCIYQSRSSIISRGNSVYLVSYILTLIIPVLFFIYCRKQWDNFK